MAKDLLDHIDFSSLECLNEAPNHGAALAMKQGYREQDELYLESDTDEQLLLNIRFTQRVRLQSIVIKAIDEAKAPKHVKLYTNRPSLGFSDTSSVPCAQELDLTPAQLAKGDPIPLKLMKFNNVDVLSIFIEDNQEGEETTKLCKIALFGTTGEVFNVAEIKKVEEK
ncbi:hypothetical protein VOLCADRAFT_109365 [Volvox carteri f. nagariensis]|uniref:PITH domain-containing protein n=1 Tax=Volvox carteri f. nagariensis TaxID=3068 RepID=D8UD67_VOLCA|nr:uncharacterized protein VOLCADRAFT_109365 [Volvox carteri f. nagariensis]EFJ42379.1 hypothetical protein VOLCADRAFT_109365 [Volvox carteri f. nagariensis]|eukprot:XP_002956612.1 hypothetical protein VOLCADRAFT_109365 [Volvox carteri f. nagariensis]